jgi:hypothetical protein
MKVCIEPGCLFLVRPFYSSLMITSEAGAYPREQVFTNYNPEESYKIGSWPNQQTLEIPQVQTPTYNKHL